MKPSENPEWHKIQGWLHPEEADWLYEQVSALPERAIIYEVGAYFGRATIAIALSGQSVFTVDHLIRPEFLENLGRFGLSYGTGGKGQVLIIQGGSVEVARERSRHFPPLPPIRFFYLNGSHEYEDVVADIRAWRPQVNGIFAVHDAAGGGAWPTVKRAVEEGFEGLEIGQCCSIAYVTLSEDIGR